MSQHGVHQYATCLQCFSWHARTWSRAAWLCLCTSLRVSCFAGDSYSVTPTEVVPTVVLPPTPPPSAAKPSESKATDSKAETSKAASAQVTPAAAAAPAAPAAQAADTLISDYGFSKNLAPMAVEEFTGKYRWVHAVFGPDTMHLLKLRCVVWSTSIGLS
jgi:hypothetical protein